MKTKGIVVLAGILLFLISCKDKKEDPSPSSNTSGTPPDTTTETPPDTTTYIIAGDSTGLYYNPNHLKVLTLQFWPSQNYVLDDSKSLADVVFTIQGSFNPYQQIVCGISSNPYYLISESLMDYGDTIFFEEPWVPSLEFAGQKLIIPNHDPLNPYYIYSGYYNGASNKFAGYRAINLNSTDTVYGWVRIDIMDPTNMTIRDFAYLVK